jgi:hypothetical protein
VIRPFSSLDELYWDTRCTATCGCKSLKEALAKHPELRKDRDGEKEKPCPPSTPSSKTESPR